MFCVYLRSLETSKRKADDINPEEEGMDDDDGYVQSACYKAKRRCHALGDSPTSSSSVMKDDKQAVSAVLPVRYLASEETFRPSNRATICLPHYTLSFFNAERQARKL